MKMKRRGFLKLLSIASGGLIPTQVTAVMTRNDVYVNQRLGVGFRAPHGWHFYSAYDTDQMHHAQHLRLELAEIDDFITELKERPLVALGQHPATKDEKQQTFSPSIVIRLELNDEHFSLEDMISGSNLYLSRLTRGYQSIDSKLGQVSGYPAAFGRYRYLFEAKNMKATPIVGRSCLICVDHYCYSINMYNHDPEDPLLSKEFNQFIQSIHIL